MTSGSPNTSTYTRTSAGNNPGGGGASADSVLASDAAACASRSFEVQQLAARVAACADHTDSVLAGLVRMELQGWQSPAGRAYRTAVSLQAAALRRNRAALQEAAAAVRRHAQNVAVSAGRPGP
jgi:hypothetical protein